MDFISADVENLIKSSILICITDRDKFVEHIDSQEENVRECILGNIIVFTNNIIDIVSKIKMSTSKYNMMFNSVYKDEFRNKMLRYSDGKIVLRNNSEIKSNFNLPQVEDNSIYTNLINVLMRIFYKSKDFTVPDQYIELLEISKLSNIIYQ